MLIGLLSCLGVAIFIERMWVLSRTQSEGENWLIQIRQSLQDGNIVEAIEISEQTKGCLSQIVKAGLTRHALPKPYIESAMELQGKVEVATLEKNVNLLSVLANLAPLLGLLGTVLGFMQAFAEMRMSGLVDISASKIGEAMEYALVTTAAGLSVAIPATVAYNFLVCKIQACVLEMETTAAFVMDLLDRQKNDAF